MVSRSESNEAMQIAKALKFLANDLLENVCRREEQKCNLGTFPYDLPDGQKKTQILDQIKITRRYLLKLSKIIEKEIA